MTTEFNAGLDRSGVPPHLRRGVIPIPEDTSAVSAEELAEAWVWLAEELVKAGIFKKTEHGNLPSQ